MTSLERRREARYQRRRAAREEKKRRSCAEYDDFENIVSFRSLYNAYRKSRRGVTWKASVQRYRMHLLCNLHKARQSLLTGKTVSKGFVEFDIIERGKLRHIRSVHISERVVQRSLCDNALVPMLRRSFIYDNGACLEGRGIDQALDRLTAHLQQFYRKNGSSNKGFALLFDFSGFFDNIEHRHCFRTYNKAFTDRRILWLLEQCVVPFGHPHRRKQYAKTRYNMAGYTGKSLGLGSQVSQITAVGYPSAIDHHIKERLRVRFYGRYMDDGYLLFRTKSSAQKALRILTRLCALIGITVNRKKTQIVKIEHGIRFLKVRQYLTESGEVKRRMDRKSITRQRRKIKALAAKVDQQKLPLREVENSHASWKGTAIRRGGTTAARKLDELYGRLLDAQPPRCKIKKRKRRNTSWKTGKKCA